MYSPLDKSKPCPFPLSSNQVYLGEDADGYYVMDGFFDNVGNMFKRMVKFTPKSFTPSNIFKAVRNTTLTTMTGGIYLALPKSVKKTMENVANVALPVVAAGVAAATLGPAVMSAVGPKLSMVSSLLGKNVSSIGKGLFDMLGRLSPGKQAEVAQRITPQDILYSEQNNGLFPPATMQMISDAERASYGYAVNTALNPVQPNPNQYFADSSLYPGLQQARFDEQMQQAQPAEGWSSGEVLGAVGAAVAVAVLIGRK